MARRRILVTSALPYANGPTHLGHMTNHAVRHLGACDALAGHNCIYVCADDTHGTPIMLKAAAEGVTPEELIGRVGTERRADFAAFGIGFDNYYTTHSAETAASPCACTVRSRRPATSRAGACARPSTRKPACSCPTATSRAPAALQHAGPVRRQLRRIAARPIRLRPDRARSRSSPVAPCRAPSPSTSSSGWGISRRCCGSRRGRAHCRPQSRTSSTMVRRRASRLGRVARRALLRLRDPGCARQVFLRLARCARRLMASFENYCKQHGLDFEEWWRPAARRGCTTSSARTSSTPLAVLAGPTLEGELASRPPYTPMAS